MIISERSFEYNSRGDLKVDVIMSKIMITCKLSLSAIILIVPLVILLNQLTLNCLDWNFIARIKDKLYTVVVRY